MHLPRLPALVLTLAITAEVVGREPATPASAATVIKDTLTPGDPAPSLGQATWLQGFPIQQFEPGHVYVLDFWATWCGPCIQSIPDMTELHARLKGQNVHVVGVAVWPDQDGNEISTKDFVAEQGDKMPYAICADDEPGTIAKSYIVAAGKEGIPSVFIVNQHGQVAWIGHPKSGMTEAVNAIVGGTFDVNAFRKEYVEKREQSAKLEALAASMQAASNEGRLEDLLQICDEMATVDPTMRGWAEREKYHILAFCIKDRARSDPLASTFVNHAFRDNAQELHWFASGIVKPPYEIPTEGRDLQFALTAAERAAELTHHSDWRMLLTLARVHFLRGEAARAVEVQTRAIQLTKDLDERAMAYLQKTLDEYKSAVKTE